jgi:hypothetical protein
MFSKPSGTVSPSFWHRHRHDELAARWAAEVGPERVIVLVGDERDHARQLRTFEELLGLRDGSLVPEPTLSNRSLTLPEVEALRAFNAAFRAEGLGTPLHTKVIRFGAAELLKQRTPPPGEPRIETPDWAIERATEVGREIIGGIDKLGVRVVGDLDALSIRPARTARAKGVVYDADAASADIGATMALGVVLASGLARGSAPQSWKDIAWPDGPIPRGAPPPRARVEPLELARVSTPLLGLILVRRLIGAAAARVRPVRRAS